MKKLINLALVISSIAPLSAFAAISGIEPKSGVNIDLQTLFNNVAGWATGLLIALSVLFVIYAAFLYLTAAGNEGNVETAKNIIIYAVIAIVIALMAQVVKSVALGLVGSQ